MKPVVCVCHPYGHDPTSNSEAVKRIGHRLLKQKCVPIPPQVFLPLLVSEERDRHVVMQIWLRLVRLADEVRVYRRPTEGMRLEIAEAERLGIPVIYETES